MTRTAVVTGASSGIGRATAAALADAGYQVIGTSRAPDAIAESNRVPGVTYRALDLTDPASVEAFAAGLGDVDVLVNNAGESQVGPLEEVPMAAVERVFAINVFGPVRLTQLIVAGMRARGRGRIVMVGSMQASFPLAYRSSYGASKAAIKGFADAGRQELAPFGVWMTTVEPGPVNTGIAERRTKYLADGSPHTKDFGTMLARLDHNNQTTGIPAEMVAATIRKAITARRPAPLYAAGSRAPLLFTLRRLLPRALVHKMVARAHGLRR